MNPLVQGLCVLLALATLSESLPQWGMDEYLAMPEEKIDSSEHGRKSGKRGTTCACGWTNKARIVGGKKTLPNEYPLMAGMFLKSENDIVCGGAIITPRHILTAAHCTYAFQPDEIVIYVGEHGRGALKNKTGNLQEMEVEKIILHEDWDDMSYNNDISLIFLKKQIRYTQFVGPACLHHSRINLVGEYLKVLGWGKLDIKGSRPDELMKVNLRVLPLLTCANNYPRDIPVNEEDKPHQLCTFNNNKDSCQGDSGGPLLWLDPATNRYTLAAVVSYGKTKCATKSPAVNTDVSIYLKWIHDKIKKSDSSMKTCTTLPK